MHTLSTKHILILLGLLSLLRYEVYSQKAETITLKDCFARAEEYSFRMEESSQKIIAARGVFDQRKTVALPEFSMDVLGNSQHLSPYNFQQVSLLAQVDWSLGDLFMKTSMVDQNKILALEAQREQVRIELMQRITILYMSILQQRVQIDLFNERLDLLREHLLMTKALWQAGTQSEIDVLQTQTEITRLEEQIVELNIQRNNSKLELVRIMGISDIDSIEVKALQLENLDVQHIPVWSDTLIESYPLVRSLNFQIQAETEKGRFIRAEQLPHFMMQTGYVSDSDPTSDGNYWQILAGLNVPIFRWGRTNYQNQQLKADVQILVMQQEEIKRELNIYLNQIMERLNNYRDIYLKQINRREFSSQAFNLANIHYQAGLITNLEYLAVQQRFTETQIALQETLLRYGVNLVEFFVITNQVDNLDILFTN